MRMGIRIGGGSVSGPTGVTDTHGSGNWFGLTSFRQIFDPTALLANFDPLSIQDRETGGVVAPVLKATEGIQENGLGISRAHIGDNSTHRKLVLPAGGDRVK